MAIPEEHIHAALDAAGLGVWHWDLRTGAFTTSPALLTAFGLDDSAMAARVAALIARIHAEDRDAVLLGLGRALATRKAQRVEGRIVRPDGTERRLATTAHAMVDRAGEPLAFTGITEDVTERREAEQQLAREREASEERRLLAAVLRHMPAGLLVVDASTGKIRIVNERAIASSGLELAPGDQFPARVHGQVFEPDGTPRASDAHPIVRSLFFGESVEDRETIFVRDDGRRLVLSISSAPLHVADGGDIDAAMAIYVDITERARLRDDLAEQRARLAAVLEAVPIGVIIAEASHGNISYVNATAKQLLGGMPIAATDVAAFRNLQAFTVEGVPMAPPDLPLVRALAHGEVSSGIELAFELDGEHRTYSRCNAVPLRNAAGEIVAAVCAFDDITREVEARRQRDQTERFRELFVGMLGHDLRSPLASILTAAGLLLRRGGLSPEDAKAAERIGAAGLRMKRMIEQILDLTRSRLGGGIPVVLQRTDVCDLVRRIVEELEAAHLGRTIQLTVRGEPRCWCDPDRLAQVVSNLVGNALQHSPPDLPVDVVVERAGQQVRVLVHNGGPPIPADLLPVIFDPFRRSSTAEKDRSLGGLGLGLYISQQIARAHGGRIEVTSSDEAGTTFTLTLPVRRGPRASASSV
ncbi:Histidine protein kinase AsgD [Minicystis rosea]|nr:Histidine protein kinase AsgD [Minicystis rosea]